MADIHPKLATYKAEKEFFVGIDSDGCAFDTMEIKHKECFIPNIINHWGLQSVSKYARAAAEFVNLYSKWRGINRWPALIMVFDLLQEWDEPMARKPRIPAVPRLRKWIEEESKLSNATLKALLDREGGEELELAHKWTEAVNATISDMVHDLPPFPSVEPSLQKLADRADMIVVSQTPCEALDREWEEHGIDKYVHMICGQEMGTKTEHLQYAAGGKYDPEKILMIGDAPGDRKAAEANNALFYPILPGHEEDSWKRFHGEAIDRFLAGTYAGDYAEKLIREFEGSLPETPPWKKCGCCCG